MHKATKVTHIALAVTGFVVFSIIINAPMVEALKLEIHTITSPIKHVPVGIVSTVRVVCPPGEQLSGGGFWIERGNVMILRQMQSLSVRESWEVVATSFQFGGDVRASAQCATILP